MEKFEVNKTYITRSVCDSSWTIKVLVVKRTEKTITTSTGKVLRIGQYDGAEYVRPLGNYSMAPIVRATFEKVGG